MATKVLSQQYQQIEHTVYNDDTEKSEIQKFFFGQTIFVTGGTGFLGKLLIEKLLRVCYDINKIYVLVRTKKGKKENDRFSEIFDAECFEPLKKKYPNFLQKVQLVNGDCLKPDVGLSPESKKMIMDEVTTIFHVAATVRFDQHLRSATYINVRSVRDLLRMAKQMPQLKGFLHVSTAYSQCPKDDIMEQFYSPPITGEHLLNVVESLKDETITKITPILLGNWPNSYVFTKAIAESVIEEEGRGLPVAMIRPAIVTTSAKEPVPGWIDNIYGVNGVTAGAGLGILRTMPADPDKYAELVPVDFVINIMIAAVWNRAIGMSKEHQNKTIPVYNYVLSSWQILTWSKFFDLAYKYGIECPTTKAIWHFCFALRPNPIMHELAHFFLHTIPAYLMDLILLCIGRKAIAVEGYKKVKKFLNVIAYFAKRNWNFGSENTQQLLSTLSQKDKELFGFDLRGHSIDNLIKQGIIGGRIYLLKDPLETIPEGRKKFLKLKIAHYIVCGFALYFLIRIALLVFKSMF
ncbi:hypothetical protein HHI36_021964 [Cryptolaemus montrouzieri]|uniref:Fatty acyl-CoA reductase n=1 Tax=Cryptolaemus montrouzieri TaxID=559131 RepID=A0ABD2MYN1_9CUCU